MALTLVHDYRGDRQMTARLYYGEHVLDALRGLPDASVQVVCTSPPYYKPRDYGVPDVDWSDGWEGQLGQEDTPQDFIAHLVEIFREVRRVLHPRGTCWVNLGDSYVGGGGYFPDCPSNQPDAVKARNFGGHTASARKGGVPVVPGLRRKSLVGIPWRFALGMMDDGWILRNDIIWHKPSTMPENVNDRCTVDHEYVFMFTQQETYFFNQDAIRTPVRASATYGYEPGTSTQVRNDEGHPTRYGDTVMGSAKGQGLRSLPPPKDKGPNRRTVWTISTKPYRSDHPAPWPPDLAERMLLAGMPPDGVCSECGSDECPCGADKQPSVALDPFSGSATTGRMAFDLGHDYVGIDLNESFLKLAKARLGSPDPTVTSGEIEEIFGFSRGKSDDDTTPEVVDSSGETPEAPQDHDNLIWSLFGS